MRKPIVAGNWKMNKTIEQARQLVNELIPGLQAVSGVEMVFCPPFTALFAVKALLEGTHIGLGAQDLYWEASGAYTSQVSPAMVAELCSYVIIGHSERRAYFGETDETVNKKVKAAFNQGLTAIVCVGESLAENESGSTEKVVSRQIVEGLKDISLTDASKLVIAYEPIWAIGTGKAATGEGANHVVGKMIRPALARVIGEKGATEIRVQYGGSVTGANAAEFFGQSDIDGALVGGASLKPDFINIVKAAKK